MLQNDTSVFPLNTCFFPKRLHRCREKKISTEEEEESMTAAQREVREKKKERSGEWKKTGLGCVWKEWRWSVLLLCRVSLQLRLLFLCSEKPTGGDDHLSLSSSASLPPSLRPSSSLLWRLGCAGRSDGPTRVHPSVLVLCFLLRWLQDLMTHTHRRWIDYERVGDWGRN